MKIILILLVLASCSSQQTTSQMQPFNKEQVCSLNSLNYLKEKSKRPGQKRTSLGHPRTLGLNAAVKQCYQQERRRTKKDPRFNLCLVVGFSNRSALEFFEFSSSEYKMTSEFEACLANLQTSKSLTGLNNLEIIQPFRLTPQ